MRYANSPQKKKKKNNNFSWGNFEALMEAQQVAPGGTITGTGAPYPPTSAFASSYKEPEQESEAVR